MQKGRRPSFEDAAPPEHAKKLVDQFISAANTMNIGNVQSGKFGADMKVELINDYPVTIQLDSDEWRI